MQPSRGLRLGLSALLLCVGFAVFGQDRATDILKQVTAPTEEAVNESEVTDADVQYFEAWTGDPPVVISVPIHDVIAGPNEYILRRALKLAISGEADVVVLDIDTPGGSVGSLLEMMEALDEFNEKGLTIAYVNNEAISAGALLSAVTEEIWYTPKAVIGSAGVVSGSGEDIAETMALKIESYLQAKIRALATEHPYKADVIKAMMDGDFELVVEGEVISKEGEMLNLTASEAMTTYGKPPTPLFGNGTAKDLEALLDERFGEGNYELTKLEVTWSEEVATYLTKIAPLLMALGLIGIFIEFKTPGFGIFGIGGIVLIGLVFATNYITGLAGSEAFLFVILGLLLIAVEIFILPGTIIFLALGIFVFLGALLWSLADVWPTIDGGITVNMDSLLSAGASLSFSVILSVVGMAVVMRYLPSSPLFDRFVVKNSFATADGAGVAGTDTTAKPSPGARGVVIRALHLVGSVEIDGQRFQARSQVEMIEEGAEIEVVGIGQFDVIVRKVQD